MKLGFVGLGRMGENMTLSLMDHSHEVVAFDTNEEARSRIEDAGGRTVNSLQEMVDALEVSRTVWLMVPRKFVDDVLAELKPLLSEGDTIIDGGNSFYKDSMRRYKELKNAGINFLDCGTSGGIEGARHGACMMIGGDREVFDKHEVLFRDMSTENGYGYMGNPGAGHYVKMIHNGIEYGMMGAIAEGINTIKEQSEVFGTSLEDAVKVYAHGSIIESRLMSWMQDSYDEKGYLDSISGEVPYGETEEEMEHVIEHADVPVLKAAVEQRVETRTKPSYIGTLIAALRNQFGGHKVKSK